MQKTRELKEAETKLKEIQKQLHENPEWQKLHEIREESERAKWKLEKKHREICSKILGAYTTDGVYPLYSRSDSYGYGVSTNIRERVLEAIRSQIGGLSKLSGGDIEEIVTKLIDKDNEENTELQELNLQIGTLEKKEREADAKLRQFETGSGMISRIQQLRGEIVKLKEIVSNPKRAKSREEREKLRSFSKSEATIQKIRTELRKNR